MPAIPEWPYQGPQALPIAVVTGRQHRFWLSRRYVGVQPPIATMSRLFLLLVSFFWQAITVAGQMTLIESAEEREHAVAHVHEVAHHHHEDGSLTHGDSSDSNIHVAMAGATGHALVWQQALVSPPLLGSCASQC